MKPRDHEVELVVPEVEVCIDTSTLADPYAEVCARPSDEAVGRAVEALVKLHYEELVDLCADEYLREAADERAERMIEAREAANDDDGRRYG